MDREFLDPSSLSSAPLLIPRGRRPIRFWCVRHTLEGRRIANWRAFRRCPSSAHATHFGGAFASPPPRGRVFLRANWHLRCITCSNAFLSKRTNATAQDFCYWHLADIATVLSDVRFWG